MNNSIPFEVNDSTLSGKFYDEIIHPTFSQRRGYFITDFKFENVNKKQLKTTKKSLKYIISSEEGSFSGIFPIADIFKD